MPQRISLAGRQDIWYEKVQQLNELDDAVLQDEDNDQIKPERLQKK